jgi:hypothetical protein
MTPEKFGRHLQETEVLERSLTQTPPSNKEINKIILNYL